MTLPIILNIQHDSRQWKVEVKYWIKEIGKDIHAPLLSWMQIWLGRQHHRNEYKVTIMLHTLKKWTVLSIWVLLMRALGCHQEILNREVTWSGFIQIMGATMWRADWREPEEVGRHQWSSHHSSPGNRWWKPAPDRIEEPGDHLDTRVRKRESAKGFAHGFIVVLTLYHHLYTSFSFRVERARENISGEVPFVESNYRACLPTWAISFLLLGKKVIGLSLL